MTIRYSGDAEVRILWSERRRRYVGTVRDPDYLWRGDLASRSPRNSDDYDDAARDLLAAADASCRAELGRPLALEREGRTIAIRRVFQSPCPILAERRRNRGRW